MDVSERDIRPVPVVVLEDVVVLVDVILRVLFGDALDVRVPGRVRVSEPDLLMLGLSVPVAVSVLEMGGDLLTVELAVGVLDGRGERVGEGEADVVFEDAMDRVEDRVTGMVEEARDVLVVHGLELAVFDTAEEELLLGEAELDFDPRGEAELVEEEEEVLEEVPEGEEVLVEVTVLVEVAVPVWVREP